VDQESRLAVGDDVRYPGDARADHAALATEGLDDDAWEALRA
jgi:hypothetical protein